MVGSIPLLLYELKKFPGYLLVLFGLLQTLSSYSQNEAKKWYFGNGAGLNFSTSPPTALANGSMVVFEGCASIADGAGNLLFYTDGSSVWNQSHNIMANGTGLNGQWTPSQSAIILKKPGSATLYYIFNVTGGNNVNFPAGAFYSIVDISLAAGQGSVTVKNVTLSSTYTAEKLTATKHCNGVDWWVLVRDAHYLNNTPMFKAFLLTSLGVNANPVLSAAPNWSNNNVFYYDIGCMKISPNGKKLGCALYNANWNNLNSAAFELHDFDNTTGVVSNSLGLAINNFTAVNNWWGGYGCEFSPDGTKLYGSRLWGGLNNVGGIFQWDLCAGSPAAILASQTSIATATVNSNWYASMQLAPDGKIYVSRWAQSALAVIHNPNALGLACNFVDLSQSISPKTSYYGLPNFPGCLFNQPPPQAPFTHTVNNVFGCQTVSFTPPPIVQNFSLIGCAGNGFSLTGFQWNFGDPASGANNTSTVASPGHAYTSLGTYTAQLILYYSCGGGTDTLKQTINVNQPCISVNSTSITCANLGSATVTALNGVGPFSYTWMPGNQTNSVATGLSPGSYTITVYDFGNNFTYTAQTIFTSLIPLTGTVLHSNSVTCFGAATGTGAVVNLTGGSGSENYAWVSGGTTLTAATPSNLSAGLWSLTVTDALTGCTINDIFIITQAPAQNPVIVASSPTSCAGTAISFTASNSGGTPGPGPTHTYTWVNGPATDTFSAIGNTAGSYIYTVESSDGNNCVVNQTIMVDYIQNPTLTVSHVSICPLETGTLSVGGASTYTWNGSLTGTTYTDNPLVSTEYTVVGSALSCTSSATASIVLKPVPNPLFQSNSPVCQNSNLLFNVSTGVSFVWSGVNGFVSVAQGNVLSAAHPTQSGVYQVTVTAANACTAATQGTVTINPTPTVSASGGTLCVTQTLNLSSNSFPGSNYVWIGPNNFVSLLQNPVIANPVVNASGYYTVTATSPEGCTNTAVAHSTVTASPILTFTSNSPQCYGKTLSFNASGSSGALNYFWSGPNSFTSALVSPSIYNATVPSSGNYTLTLTTGPCVVSASQGATIHPLPVPMAFNTAPVCEGKPFQVGVNNSGVTYTWTGPGGYYSNQQNINFATAQLNQSGEYTVQVTDANTCQNYNTTSVTILANPVVNATGDLVCFGQPAQLSATGADNYYWQGPGSFTALGANPIVDPAINTQVWTYTVMGTAANGCTAVTTATIGTRVLPLPTLSVTPRVCVLSTVYLNGNGGLSYYWTGPLNYSSSQQNTSFLAGNIGMSGIYTLMVMDAFGCRGYTTAPVIVDPEPTGQIAGKLSGCVPFCSTYSLQSSEGNVINSIWTFNNQSVNSSTVAYCFNTPGNFELKGSFEDDKTCKGTITQMVQVFPLPVADFEYSPVKPIENQDMVVFTNTSEGENQNKWHWAINDGKNTNSASENTSCFFEDAGNYAVAFLVRNSWGCWDTIVKSIEVALDFNVYIPNAFTPNEDGLNDVFFPVMRGVKRYELQIFNRWGELIFVSDDPKVKWDGTLKGEPCQQGVYNYKLTVLNNSGDEKNYTGDVNLLR